MDGHETYTSNMVAPLRSIVTRLGATYFVTGEWWW